MNGQSMIRYNAAAGIAWLTIDQKNKMNAMTYEMWGSLPALVARAVNDSDIRFIAIQGAGDQAFCSGADISQFKDKRSSGDAIALYDKAVAAGMNALLNAKKPTIAIIRGICFGGGCAMALACDLRLATADSRFAVPAAKLGLGYGYDQVAMLVSKLGAAAATELLITADTYNAADAHRLGLIQRIWPREFFETEAGPFLATIAGNAPLTLRAVKSALIDLAKPDNQRDRAGVEAMIAACSRSADYREGQTAFLAKRQPVFRGE